MTGNSDLSFERKSTEVPTHIPAQIEFLAKQIETRYQVEIVRHGIALLFDAFLLSKKDAKIAIGYADSGAIVPYGKLFEPQAFDGTKKKVNWEFSERTRQMIGLLIPVCRPENMTATICSAVTFYHDLMQEHLKGNALVIVNASWHVTPYVNAALFPPRLEDLETA